MSNSKMEAAALYAVVFLAAVFWFDLRTDSLSEARQIMVPYFPVFYAVVVISSTLLAAYLSDLYLRDHNRWITFASAMFQPVAVLLTASFIGAVGLAFFLHFGLGAQPDAENGAIWGVISLTLNALSVCLLFIAIAWPVLLLGLVAATCVLWFRHGRSESEEQRGSSTPSV
jgi:hypothetical protein